MRRTLLTAAAVILASVACSDRDLPTVPPISDPDFTLLDGAHGGGGGFFFLPPLAEQPSPSGTFDAEVAAEVRICAWGGSSCGAVLATFDTDGRSSERVRANGSEGHYVVNWHTRDTPLADGGVYRISVTAEGAELGYVDVMAYEKGSDARVREMGYAPVKIGQTVPIKFRIEVGAYQPPTATLVGVVTSVGGTPLAGVLATLEGTAVEGATNGAGGVTLAGIRTGRTAVIRLARAGYVDQLVRVEIPSGATTLTFRTSLLPQAPPVSLSAAAGGVASGAGGTSVSLPPGALVDASGASVTGDVSVTMTPVDVSGPEIAAFPGSFIGVNAAGESGLLMSYGLAEFTFEKDGVPLQLADGATAVITIPIYAGANGLSVGDPIPLWYLDEPTGEWQEEATGTVIALPASPTGLGLEATVTHFSWWNVDVWVSAPYEPLVRCMADGSPVDCTVRATIDDPSFPRTNAASFVPAAGLRLTFPPAPAVTELSGEAGNRFGALAGGVSGPSGGGAADTVWVDLVNEGVLSAATSVITVNDSAVEIPDSITVSVLSRDGSGAPMTVGGATVAVAFADSVGRTLANVIAQDRGDGTYSAATVPPSTGTLTVRAALNGQLITTGNPTFVATYAASAGRGAFSVVTVSPASVPEGGTATFTLHAYDASGTPKATGGDVVSFSLSTGALVGTGTVGPTTDHGDGTYSATFTGTSAGTPAKVQGHVNFEVAGGGSPSIAVSPTLLTEAEADAALAAAFNDWWLAGHDYDIAWAMATMADGPSSSWGNAGMRDMSSEPRVAWNNDPAYGNAAFLLRRWSRAYSAISRAHDVLWSLNNGLQLGPGGADNDRARAAATLVLGLAHGEVALAFDKGFVLDGRRNVATASIPLRPYTAVMDSAVSFLSTAAAYGDGGSFTFPSHWIPGTALDGEAVSRLAHAYSARFMAAVARTPAERSSVDWTEVLGHLGQAINSDFAPVGDGDSWFNFYAAYVHTPTWFVADYRLVGGVTPGDPETDPNSGFAAWLATPVDDRAPYTSTTADLRIWDQTLDFGNPRPGTYFTWDPIVRLRPERGTYHLSNYRFTRFPSGYGLNPGDLMPAITTTELGLLEAEARWRLGIGGAAALINLTRVGHGGLSAATDGDADLLEKLAYEKRLETYHQEGGLLYFDRRGWGDPVAPTGFGLGLMEGTPLHFPVPGAELDRLGIPNYTYGGAGPAMASEAEITIPASRLHRLLPRPDRPERLVPDGPQGLDAAPRVQERPR